MDSLILSFGLTLFFIYLIKPLAIKLNLVDRPGGRKSHEGEVPLIGGIAIFLGFTFALLATQFSLQAYRPLIAASGLLVIMGVFDDFHELSARLRLVAQLIAALIMVVLGHNYLSELGNLVFIGNIHLGLFAIPVTLFATVGIINAVNMLDGLDGLAGTQALAIAFSYLILAAIHGNYEDSIILSILISALIAFLLCNFPLYKKPIKALIFMGDAGSMFIGFILCWFAIDFSQGSAHWVRPVCMIWIFLVPLLDTLRVILYRLLNQRSPFHPGRDHIHHYLLEQGCSSVQTTLILFMISLVGGSIGLLGEYFKMPEGILFSLFILVFIGFYFGTSHKLANKGI